MAQFSVSTALAILAVVAGGERGTVRELQELRRTAEQLKSELAKSRQDEGRHRAQLLDLQRQLAGRCQDEEETEPEPPTIKQLQAQWLAHPAGEVGPEDTAWARSIAEQEYDYLRRMGDRVVEDYGQP
jgi:hypothetical protein